MIATDSFAILPIASETQIPKIDSIITILRNKEYDSTGKKILKSAQALMGSGRDDYYAKDSTANLRVNIENFTPMTFINTVIALAKSAENNNQGIVTFEENLQKFSCRRGENEDFSSLMWHASDWIADNGYRGNIEEFTERVQGNRSTTKSLDYLTRHRDDFEVLKNNEIYDKVRMTEMGFRTHKIPYLPKQYISNKEFLEDVRDGDILVLVRNSDGTDIFEIGIVEKENNNLNYIHYDAKKGEVVAETGGLKKYLNLISKYVTGFRWLRVND